MSFTHPDFDRSLVIREADAEVIGRAPTTIRLLADSHATGGALSTQRVTLAGGVNGANPHHHANSAELSYLLDGTAQLLSGDQVLTAGGTWSSSRRMCRTPLRPPLVRARTSSS